MSDNIYENLVTLLKLFKDKPQYLVKFLLENNAFTEEFLKKVFDSTELKRINTLKDSDVSEKDIFSQLPHFKDITSMNNYFSSIINGKNKPAKSENIYDLINKNLREKIIKDLDDAIENENYLLAASIRDRMKELNIRYKKL